MFPALECHPSLQQDLNSKQKARKSTEYTFNKSKQFAKCTASIRLIQG